MGLVKASLPSEECVDAVPSQAALVAALAHDDPAERRRAARMLAGDPAGAEALCARLEQEADPSVREAIGTGLMHHPTPLVVERLLAFLRAEDAALRNQAIELLASMPDVVGRRIEEVLADEDSDVRIFAVNILATLPHARVPEWLAHVVDREEHINVCAAAVDVLAEIGTPADIPALRNLRRRFAADPFLVFACDAAIARIGGP